MMNAESEPQPLQEGAVNVEASNQKSSNQDVEPIYVKLYEKTHRIGKNNEMDPEAEANLNALKALHAKEVEENGVDNLTPFEAFPKVMNECSGYIRGLGAGPKPPRKTKRGANSSEVIDEIQQLQQEKDDLGTEVSNLKSDNTMLKEEMERMRIESLEREKKLREESIERERKMKEELMTQMMNMV